MIELKNIHKSYGEKKAINGINLTFLEGEICIVLGPSGCGKSTMLKLINRLLVPDQGEISIHGREISSFQIDTLRRSIGYSIQGVGLFPHMTVSENIGIVPTIMKWKKDKIEDRVTELLELVGLTDHYREKYPIHLSGGEAQRVGVARSLAADPEILLMDEPFGALDPINRRRLQQEFLKIQSKLHKTVIFVTHDVGEAVRMADKLVLMKDGQIVDQGSPFSMIDKADQIITTFTGSNYAFELLEKRKISDLIHELMPLKPTTHNIAIHSKEEENQTEQEFSDEMSLKEALVAMIIKGSSELVVNASEGRYLLEFGVLAKAIRRGEYE